jgi:predicted RNA-binding Zn-ribbon protein involved in translation (DUF1610 family)
MRRKPMANRLKTMSDAFAVFGVKKEQLEKFNDKPLTDWNAEDIDKMQGIYNALRDEETTVEQVFGVRQEPVEPSKLTVKTARAQAPAGVIEVNTFSKVTPTTDPQEESAEFEKKKKKAIDKLNAATVKDYCPYCKATVDIEHEASKNKAGEYECGDCGYILTERPK